MVSPELLDKFKNLYKEQFDIKLTDEEATEMATSLVNLMKILVKPIPKSEINELVTKERSPDETNRQYASK